MIGRSKYLLWTILVLSQFEVLTSFDTNIFEEADTEEEYDLHDGAAQDGAAQDGAVEDGAVESGAGESGAGESGAGESGAGESGAGEIGAGESGAAEDGAAEDGAVEDGAAQDGAVESGAAESGAAQDGAAQNGGAEDSGGEDSGGEDSGGEDSGAQDGAAQDGGGEDSGGEDSGGEDGGAEDSGGEDSGAQDGAAQDGGGEDSGGEDSGGEDSGGEDSGGEDSGGEDSGGENAAAQDDAAQDGAAQDGGGEDSGGEDSGGEDAAAEDGAAQDEAAEDGGHAEDGGGEDSGGEDSGGEDGGGEDSGGEDAAAEDGGGENGAGEDGAPENGGGEDGAADQERDESEADLPATNKTAILTQYPPESELEAGSIVIFNCTVFGFPLPDEVILTHGDRELVSYNQYNDASSNGGPYGPVQSGFHDAQYGDEYYDDESSAGYVEDNNYHGTIDDGYYDNPYLVGDVTDPSRYVERGENFVIVSKMITLQLNNTSEYKCQGFFYGSSRVFDTRNLTVVSDVVVRIAVSNETPNNGQGFNISCNVTGGRRPHKVELKQNGFTIASTDRQPSFCRENEHDAFTLICRQGFRASDEGGVSNYSCIGTNIVANGLERSDKKSVFVYVPSPVSVKVTSRVLQTKTTSQIICEVKGVLEPHKVVLTKPDSSFLTWERHSFINELDCNGTHSLLCNYTITNPGISYEGTYKCQGFNVLQGSERNYTEQGVVKLNGTSFCDKCSDDAYNRGLSSASEGCYNCACLDGSRQCGCQPGCPDIPARPNVIKRLEVPLDTSMVSQNGTHSYSRNNKTIDFNPGLAIDGDMDTFSVTKYVCGQNAGFLWYKVKFGRVLAVDEVDIIVALSEEFETKMDETLKIVVVNGSREFACGTLTYVFEQDRIRFKVTCNGLVGEEIMVRKVYDVRYMCGYLAIAEIAVYETFRDEPEVPDKSCADNEFSCHDNSTCLLKSQQCDGRKDCTDGSDETNCPNIQLDCAPLSHHPSDKTSTISCSNSTTCSYSCVNTTWRFPLEESGGVVLVSEMEITCDEGTSQWSHVTPQNPLGHFPSCREITPAMPTTELVMNFPPPKNNNFPRSKRSADQTLCPEPEVVRSVEGLVVVQKGECHKYDLPVCVQIAGRNCVFLNDGTVQLTVILEFNISRDPSFTEQDHDEYNSKFVATDIAIIVNGTYYDEGNDTSTRKTKTCPEGLVKILVNADETFCFPCDKGEYYNSNTSTCQTCPLNTYSWKVGSTMCASCPGDTVTPRIGSRGETQCVPPDEVCTIRGDSGGRRSIKSGTKVMTNSRIMTFCNYGYSLAYNAAIEQTCSFLDKTPKQCHKVCRIVLPKSNDDVHLYDTNNKYNAGYLRYKHTVQYSCSGKYGNVTCDAPGENLFLSECETEIVECQKLVEISAVYGNYTWPKTLQNKEAELPCFWNNESQAQKFCTESGFFRDTNFTDCQSAVAEEISKILEDAAVVTADSQDSVSEQIRETTAESGEQMSSSDVLITVQIIDVILGAPDMGISDTTLNNLMTTMDNVQTNTEVSEVRRDDTSDKLRESAVNIVGEIAETGKKDSFTPLNSIGFAVAAGNIFESEKKNVLALAGETNIINDSTNQDGTLDTYFRAEITTANDELATAVYYETDKAFPSNAVSSESAVDDKFQIIAGKISGNADSVQQSSDTAPEEVSVVATVISDINIVDNISYEVVDADFSDRKFEMMFTVKDETELNVHRFTKRKTLVTTKLACKFYDTETKLWNDEGCTTSMISYDEVRKETDVTCICDHLTSFAVLMSFSSEESHLEELVSHILLAISLFFLLLTLLAILPNKKSLKARPTQVNLMLILALILSIVCFFLMDFFVSAEEDVEPSVPCSVIAFLLNYFWLCQLSWMIIEAVTMYIALVQVFGTYISKAILKYSLIGWSVPLIFPIIGIAWGGTDFADPKTCFIKYPYGLATFYGPVVLGVAVNWILFVFIARVILKASKAKAKKTGDSNVKMRSKQLQSALAVSTLLGLSWIIGFFLLMNDSNYGKISLVFRWLFIALNAPQGFFIFVFYVLLKEDVRKFWLQKFRRKVKSPVSYTGAGSNDKGHRKKESSSLVISNDLQSTSFTSTGNDSLLLTNRHTERSKPTTSASNINKEKPLTPVSEVQMPLSVPLSLELSGTNENEYQDDEAMYCSPDELDVTFEPVTKDTDHVTVSLNTPLTVTPEFDQPSNPQLAEDNIYAEDQAQFHIENMSKSSQIEQNLNNSYEDVQPAAVQNEAVDKAQVQIVDSSDSEWDKASSESDPVYSDLPELANTSSLSVQTPQIEQKPQSEQHIPQIEHQTPHSEQKPQQNQSKKQPLPAQSEEQVPQLINIESDYFELLLLTSGKDNKPEKVSPVELEERNCNAATLVENQEGLADAVKNQIGSSDTSFYRSDTIGSNESQSDRSSDEIRVLNKHGNYVARIIHEDKDETIEMKLNMRLQTIEDDFLGETDC